MKYEIEGFPVGSIGNPERNEGGTLEIYDLNTAEIIYRQQVKGFVGVQKSSKDFVITKSANNLVVGSFRKLLKRIERMHHGR